MNSQQIMRTLTSGATSSGCWPLLLGRTSGKWGQDPSRVQLVQCHLPQATGTGRWCFYTTGAVTQTDWAALREHKKALSLRYRKVQ